MTPHRNRIRSSFSLLASLVLAASSASQASSVGYTDYVTTQFGGTGQWSLWDVFPRGSMLFPGAYRAMSFTDRDGDSGTSGAGFSAAISGGTPGALLFPDGQGTSDSSLYLGGATITFTISGIAETAINNLVFQIKQDVTPPEDLEDPAPTPGLEFWEPVISWTGGTIGAVVADHGDVFTDGVLEYSVTYWQFEDLNITAGSEFSLSFSLAGGADAEFHQNLDGFRIDADGTIGAVPEPTSGALIAMGLAFLACKSRRRKAQD